MEVILDDDHDLEFVEVIDIIDKKDTSAEYLK